MDAFLAVSDNVFFQTSQFPAVLWPFSQLESIASGPTEVECDQN
jgi:hypothetical protein